MLPLRNPPLRSSTVCSVADPNPDQDPPSPPDPHVFGSGPDSLVRSMDPDPDPALDPDSDPSIIKQI
jgi:hypothetical protein